MRPFAPNGSVNGQGSGRSFPQAPRAPSVGQPPPIQASTVSGGLVDITDSPSVASSDAAWSGASSVSRPGTGFVQGSTSSAVGATPTTAAPASRSRPQRAAAKVATERLHKVSEYDADFEAAIAEDAAAVDEHSRGDPGPHAPDDAHLYHQPNRTPSFAARRAATHSVISIPDEDDDDEEPSVPLEQYRAWLGASQRRL